jgi:UDP-N-acetylmuramoylalanine--D-glutamate ligase
LDHHRDSRFGLTGDSEDSLMGNVMICDAKSPPGTNPIADYAVIGLGISGRSVVNFLAGQGHSVLAMDERTDVLDVETEFNVYPNVKVFGGPLDAEKISRCGQVVVSPGVPLEEPAVAAAISAGCEVIGDIELFARRARAPIVAITGTNGKSTVTTLVAKMLEAAGKEVRCGGNLGTPALALLGTPEPDFYVLEVSSFQLELTTTLAPNVACLLNITPDHLDRHHTFERYIAAKARILTRAAIGIVNADDEAVRALSWGGLRVEFSLGEPNSDQYGLRSRNKIKVLAIGDSDILDCAELALPGAHNIANVLAAIAVVDACGIDRTNALTALKTFSGLPHRCERVAMINDVQFINDSKATNPGAASASVKGVMASVAGGVVIAGGQSKRAPFDEFTDAIATYAHTLVLLGEAGSELSRLVDRRVACVFATDMDAAVRAAAAAARAGEVVLLAPACASFDMYENYAVRGDAFRAAVAALGAP